MHPTLLARMSEEDAHTAARPVAHDEVSHAVSLVLHAVKAKHPGLTPALRDSVLSALSLAAE